VRNLDLIIEAADKCGMADARLIGAGFHAGLNCLSDDVSLDAAIAGFVNALRTYKPETARFSTYAYVCMDMERRRAIHFRYRTRKGRALAGMVNEAADGDKLSWRSERVVDGRPGPLSHLETSERAERIRAALRTLDDRDRRIVTAVLLDGEQQTDVAKRFRITRQRVGQIIRRCAVTLRSQLRSYAP
jgi:RNA polymerase sigma factor (sigma-70 family)